MKKYQIQNHISSYMGEYPRKGGVITGDKELEMNWIFINNILCNNFNLRDH